jgi:hypothetical protein
MWRHEDIILIDVSEKNVSPPSSGQKEKEEKSASEEPAWAPKRRLIQYLHSATSQKTVFFSLCLSFYSLLNISLLPSILHALPMQ